MNAMEISLSGLDVEWRRMEVIALNLANMNTTRTGDGGPYIPQRLVSGPAESFEQVFDKTERSPTNARLQGVRTLGIEASSEGVQSVYEPGHPHADKDGFVAYPNVNRAEEMISLVKTARTYEANLVAMAAARQIYSSALQIGRQS